MTGATPLIEATSDNGVTTLTMSNPKRLNGWTESMMGALREAIANAAANNATQALILTGTGRYYSAGVNLSGTMRPMHPQRLRDQIIEHNQALFDLFLDFPKPILAAVNGHAIGAPVTSATLCDAVIAAESATFLLPFHRLGVPPEGCSSVHLPRLMGEENAQRMLGAEGWKPTARQAQEAGLITHVAADDELMTAAQTLAAQWVATGKVRAFRGGSTRDELKRVNARESVDLANAFLSPPFLNGQFKFLLSKKKYGPALMFLGLRATHPAWSLLIRD